MAVNSVPATEAATAPGESHTLKRGAIGLAGVVSWWSRFRRRSRDDRQPSRCGRIRQRLRGSGRLHHRHGGVDDFQRRSLLRTRQSPRPARSTPLCPEAGPGLRALAAGVMSMFVYMIMEAGVVGLFSTFPRRQHRASVSVIAALVGVTPSSRWRPSAPFRIETSRWRQSSRRCLSAKSHSHPHCRGRTRPRAGNRMEFAEPVIGVQANGVMTVPSGSGLLMAFWCWVGFEPRRSTVKIKAKRIVPRATMTGHRHRVCYTFIAWAVISRRTGRRNGGAGIGNQSFRASPTLRPASTLGHGQ